MANSWFRLWTDMVNDPKWRTIARVSGQKVGDVIAVYLHMMTMAANATERGETEGFNDEDVATALDIDTEQVTAIRAAMQGRVLDGDRLTGWEKRQPLREDGAAERSKSFRERKKAESERTQTQQNASERQIREEEIREELTTNPTTPDGVVVPSDAGDDLLDTPVGSPAKPDCPHQEIIAIYHEVLPQCPQIRDWTPARATQLRARWNEDPQRQNLDYWRRFFEYVKSCDFLVGRSGKNPFFADLEWITKSGNFTKIREEKYANRG